MPKLSKRVRKILRFLAFGALGVVVLATVALLIAYTYYGRVVEAQFEGRRWTLPARVYGAPLELYTGLSLSAEDLHDELERLKYVQADEPKRTGTYRRRGARFDIAVRPARFADESRAAQIISVTASSSTITSLRDARGQNLPIFRMDPLLIGSIFPIHGEDRIVLSPDEVPPLLPAAIKAVEDRRFDSHSGLDPEAILRAAWVNLRAGRVQQGGSTLTQQLVKSYFLDNRRTLGRKAEEALMALALEARYDKRDLMTAYINEIYLGQQGNRAVHGFGLASQFYFAKPLGELNLHEMALLVAIVRGPPYYDPRRQPERATARRNLVLKLLASQQVITEEEAQQAAAEPLDVSKRPSGGYYPAYLDFVRRTLRRDYREQDLTEAGLTVFTSFDPYAQSVVEASLEKELTRLDRKPKDGAPPRKLEGAVVLTVPSSNEVIAMVGGRQAGFDGFNRALDAKRPIGSLVKPFVFLAAFETGRYDAATIVPDEPITVKLSRTQVWKPQNFTREAYGPVPVVRALGDSLNLATVHVGMDVGVEKVAKELVKMGLTTEPAPRPALLLGALDLPPLEVAQLYNALANGGFNSPLRAVRAVLDADGKALKAYPVDVTPVASPEIVYQIDRVLTQVVEHGTSRAARAALPTGLIVAGKTGSSSDLRDSWFAGFSGSHLGVVWVGYDDNQPTGVTGSIGALSVWSRVMADLHTISWPAFPPESLEEVSVDYKTGLRIEPGCATSTQPIEVSTIAVPRGRPVPFMPGCGAPAQPPGVVERVEGFLRGIIGQ